MTSRLNGEYFRKETSSGGATVCAARGKRLCCRLRQSDQFCNQGIFQNFAHAGVNQPLVLLFPPLLFLHLSSPFSTSPSHLPPLSLPSLRSRPFKPARRSGECYKLPRRGLGPEIEFDAF